MKRCNDFKGMTLTKTTDFCILITMFVKLYEVISMWFDEAVLYQIYPLGFCGAPLQNDGVPASRLSVIKDWAAHTNLKLMVASAM
jgi:hypothetical protein